MSVYFEASKDHLILYQHENYGGVNRTIDCSVAGLGSFNDQASSARVYGMLTHIISVCVYNLDCFPEFQAVVQILGGITAS